MDDFKRFEEFLNEKNEELERENSGSLDKLGDGIKPTGRMVLLTMPELIWKALEWAAEINGKPLEELLNPVVFHAVIEKFQKDMDEEGFVNFLAKLLTEGRK